MSCEPYYSIAVFGVNIFFGVSFRGSDLSQAGFSRGGVAPLLDDGPLHPPGVGLGPGTHLLRHRDALLPRHQLRYQLGHLASEYMIFTIKIHL